MSATQKCSIKIFFILYIISSLLTAGFVIKDRHEALSMIRDSISQVAKNDNLTNNQKIAILEKSQHDIEDLINKLPNHFYLSIFQVLLVAFLYGIFHFFRVAFFYIKKFSKRLL